MPIYYQRFITSGNSDNIILFLQNNCLQIKEKPFDTLW